MIDIGNRWKFTYDMLDSKGEYVAQVLDMPSSYIDQDMLEKGLIVVLNKAVFEGEGNSSVIIKEPLVQAIIPIKGLVSAVKEERVAK